MRGFVSTYTVVNIKKGPAIHDSASYSMSSCPFSVGIGVPDIKKDKNNALFFGQNGPQVPSESILQVFQSSSKIVFDFSFSRSLRFVVAVAIKFWQLALQKSN